MKETINYYQKLNESSIAFATRKVWRIIKNERNWNKENKSSRWKSKIRRKYKKKKENWKMLLKSRIGYIYYSDEEQEQMATEDHEDLVRNLKFENSQKLEKLKKHLTAPKQIRIEKMK